MAATWLEFWDRDTPIYVNARHKGLHYRDLGDEIASLVPFPGAAVLDHGCGEALEAGRVAAACGWLLLCDGAPGVRAGLDARTQALGNVAVVSPEEVAALPDGSLDLVVANSLAQYLTRDELRACLATWRAKLKPDGMLVLADVLPPGLKASEDVAALLSYGWRGGFLLAAVGGLVRTALSDYAALRRRLGLARYGESEMLALLREAGFAAERRDSNLGHNQARMAFEARPLS